MSLFIKGADIPRGCYECFYSSECFWRCNTISGNCPMVEVPDVHGDLIDVDELNATYLPISRTQLDKFEDAVLAIPVDSVIRSIEAANVLIPAENK